MTNEQTIAHFEKHWAMKIVSEKDGSFTANGLTVRPELRTESRSSIGNIVITEQTDWVIEGLEQVHASWEPDAHELVELSRENNLALAFAKIKQLELEWAIRIGVENEIEAMELAEFDEFIERAEAQLAEGNL